MLCLGFLVHFVVADKRSLAVGIVVNTGRNGEDREENDFGRRRGEGRRRESADEKGEGGARRQQQEEMQQQQQWRSMGPLARHRALFTKGNDGVPFCEGSDERASGRKWAAKREKVTRRAVTGGRGRATLFCRAKPLFRRFRLSVAARSKTAREEHRAWLLVLHLGYHPFATMLL